MPIRTLEQLCEQLEYSLERAETKNWCVLTLLNDDDTAALLSDLQAARNLKTDHNLALAPMT